MLLCPLSSFFFFFFFIVPKCLRIVVTRAGLIMFSSFVTWNHSWCNLAFFLTLIKIKNDKDINKVKVKQDCSLSLITAHSLKRPQIWKTSLLFSASLRHYHCRKEVTGEPFQFEQSWTFFRVMSTQVLLITLMSWDLKTQETLEIIEYKDETTHRYNLQNKARGSRLNPIVTFVVHCTSKHHWFISECSLKTHSKFPSYIQSVKTKGLGRVLTLPISACWEVC